MVSFSFWCNLSGENLCKRIPFWPTATKEFFLRSRSEAMRGRGSSPVAHRATCLSVLVIYFPATSPALVRTYAKEYRPCSARRGRSAREIFFVNSRVSSGFEPCRAEHDLFGDFGCVFSCTVFHYFFKKNCFLLLFGAFLRIMNIGYTQEVNHERTHPPTADQGGV